MNDNLLVFITIAGMGAVTYLTRALGYFISAQIDIMPRSVESLLSYIPGTIIISIIAPQMIEGGGITLSASILCILASVVFKNLVAVMVSGVVYVSLLRHFF